MVHNPGGHWHPGWGVDLRYITAETTPPKTNMVHLKMGAPWKFGDSYWFHHHFQVPAVNFWGCSFFLRKNPEARGPELSEVVCEIFPEQTF